MSLLYEPQNAVEVELFEKDNGRWVIRIYSALTVPYDLAGFQTEEEARNRCERDGLEIASVKRARKEAAV